MISSMRGSPKQHVPGQAYDRSPAFSRKSGNQERRDGLYAPQDPDVIPGVRDWKIYKKDIEMHGPSDGCAGCKAIVTGSLSKQPHTINCRRRLQELIMETEEGRMRVQRAAQRVEGAANHPDDRQQGGEEVLPPPAEPPRPQTQASAAPSQNQQDQDMAPGPQPAATQPSAEEQARTERNAKNLERSRKAAADMQSRRQGQPRKRRTDEPTEDGSRDTQTAAP